jgi:TetR/AcrR family transcriptional regulator, cholesterol catabolism regulator
MARSRIRSSGTDTSPQPNGATPETPTSERLFDTAAALFFKKGYAETTTREIASAVGIQQASLYYHVESKEDLLYQICVSSLEQLLLDVQTAVNEASDPLERIRVLARTHLRTILRHQIRHVTMLNELRALSDPHRAAVVALRKKYAALVRSVLEDAQAAGAVRGDIPARFLYLALLNILNWAVLWFRRDQALSVDQLARIFTSVYLTGAAAVSERDRLMSEEQTVSRRKAASKLTALPDGPQQSTSERLLETAAALFSKKGYAASSTRKIAGILGIQKASLYHHIENKEDLLYAICKSSLEQIRSDVATALEKVADPLERTRTLVRAHVENLIRDQDKHAAAVSEMRALSGSRLAEVIHLRDQYEELVRSVLQDAQQAGALRGDIPAKYLCLALLGLLNRVEVWYRHDGDLSPVQLEEVFETIFLAGAAAQAGPA